MFVHLYFRSCLLAIEPIYLSVTHQFALHFYQLANLLGNMSELYFDWHNKYHNTLHSCFDCNTFCRNIKWGASNEFGAYRLCEQRRFRRACASAQSRQNLRYSPMQTVSQEEPSDGKPDSWPLWIAGHARLKFVMTECSKTQIRLTGLRFDMMTKSARTRKLMPL